MLAQWDNHWWIYSGVPGTCAPLPGSNILIFMQFLAKYLQRYYSFWELSALPLRMKILDPPLIIYAKEFVWTLCTHRWRDCKNETFTIFFCSFGSILTTCGFQPCTSMSRGSSLAARTTNTVNSSMSTTRNNSKSSPTVTVRQLQFFS